MADLSSGSGVIPINGVTEIYSSEVIYTSPSGEVFLQSGNLIPTADIGNYPDALKYPIIGDYTGVNVAVTATDLCFGQGFLWILGGTGNKVYQHNAITGLPTGVSWNCPSYTRSICWDETNSCFWLIVSNSANDSNSVLKYTSAGVSASFGFTVTTPYGSTFYGIEWVVDRLVLTSSAFSNNRQIDEYTRSGKRLSWASTEMYRNGGLCFDGFHLWCVNASGSSGATILMTKPPRAAPAGINTDMSAQSATIRGLAHTGPHFWMLGNFDKIYQYHADKVIGLPIFSSDGVIPRYFKLK